MPACVLTFPVYDWRESRSKGTQHHVTFLVLLSLGNKVILHGILLYKSGLKQFQLTNKAMDAKLYLQCQFSRAIHQCLSRAAVGL